MHPQEIIGLLGTPTDADLANIDAKLTDAIRAHTAPTPGTHHYS